MDTPSPDTRAAPLPGPTQEGTSAQVGAPTVAAGLAAAVRSVVVRELAAATTGFAAPVSVTHQRTFWEELRAALTPRVEALWDECHRRGAAFPGPSATVSETLEPDDAKRVLALASTLDVARRLTPEDCVPGGGFSPPEDDPLPPVYHYPAREAARWVLDRMTRYGRERVGATLRGMGALRLATDEDRPELPTQAAVRGSDAGWLRTELEWLGGERLAAFARRDRALLALRAPGAAANTDAFLRDFTELYAAEERAAWAAAREARVRTLAHQAARLALTTSEEHGPASPATRAVRGGALRR